MISKVVIDKEELIRLYVDMEKSTIDIAKTYNCCSATVRSLLIKYNIKLRTLSESKLVQFKNGRKPWNTGLTKETNESVANISKGRKAYLDNNPEAMAKLLDGQVRFSEKRWEDMSDEERNQFLKERTDKLTIGRNKPEAIEKQKQGMIEANENNPELAKNHSKFMKQFILNNPEYIEEQIAKLNAGLNASWESPEGREKRIDALYKTWQDPEIKARRVSATLKGNQIRPTNIEQTVIDVINEYNLPYKYVGNGEVIIEGKNPDFINVNGLKSVIEVYGRYWHQIEDEPERIEFFLRYGFRTLILWDREIENVPHEEIYQKILKFTEECMVEFRKIHPIVIA
jgi:very-short-patch-repair endonuclease